MIVEAIAYLQRAEYDRIFSQSGHAVESAKNKTTEILEVSIEAYENWPDARIINVVGKIGSLV